MIPYIIETLEAILECFINDKPDVKTIKRFTRGLGRLITDDYDFSESPIGNSLLHLNSEIIHMEENTH
jgi:hypothetical protein